MDILMPSSLADPHRWDGVPFSQSADRGPRAGDRRDDFTREVGREPVGPPLVDGPYARARAAILRYDIFPPGLMRPLLRRTPIEAGDTVALRFCGFRVVHLFFAARVLEVFDGEVFDGEVLNGPVPDGPRATGWRAGFTYRTLEGHPELGEETFAVERDPSGRVVVSLRSWSRPGILLTRVFFPVTRWIQVRANQAALDNLELRTRSPIPS